MFILYEVVVNVKRGLFTPPLPMFSVPIITIFVLEHPLEGDDGEANRSADGGRGGVALAHGNILQHPVSCQAGFF